MQSARHTAVNVPTAAVQSQCEENAVAYAVEWQQSPCPILYQLLQKKINVRVLSKPASYSGKGASCIWVPVLC